MADPNSDRDIAAALQGQYGKWADFAAQLPASWDAATRNRTVAQKIASEKGINTSGQAVNDDGQFYDANKKTLLDHLVDISPYIIGGVAGAGALGAFGGVGGAAGGTSAGAAAVPTTLGIESATSLGLPVTAGLGSAGGAAAAGGAAILPTLASTSTVPSTGALVPATTSSLAGGGSTGILDTIKSAYDWYNKGKNVYDTVSGGNNGPSAAQALGQTAGSIEQQRMNALIKEAELQQAQDRLGLERTTAGVGVGNLDLAQKKQALAAPGSEAQNSVRGDILANSRDASFSGLPSYIHVPTLSGGLRPSMLSDSSRQLGAKMSRDALTRSMSGADTNFAPLPTVPNATPLPSATGLDSLLQGVGGASSILGALGSLGGSTSGGSTPGMQAGGTPYDGAGTPGFPGDGTSASNPMFPQPPNGPPDQAAADPTPTGAGDMDPSILEWLKRNGQAS